jgi:hypothetical protein
MNDQGVCFGQHGGHARGRGPVDRHIPIPDRPDMQLTATEAPTGEACIATVTVRRGGKTAETFHAAELFLYRVADIALFWSDVPRTYVLADQDGTRLINTRADLNFVMVADARYLLDAWRAATEGPDAPVEYRDRGGRPEWSGGYWLDEHDFLETLRKAMDALLANGTDPTQGTVLGWLADHIDKKFGECDATRMRAWCTRAGVRWIEMKREAKARFRAGFAPSRGPGETLD